MPYNVLNLQLFGEEGTAGGTDTSGGVATATAENSATAGTDTGSAGEQTATAQETETFDSLISGRYKEDYEKKISEHVQEAVNRRFKNQKNLQSRIDSIDPIIRSLATKYNVKANSDGSIPIEQLQAAIDNDDSLYEQEAFERGIGVEDLKTIKRLERENESLKRSQAQSREAQEWQQIVKQGEALKEVFPSFDLDSEMQNPQFGKLLATLQGSGFPNALEQVYKVVHMDDIMSGAMRHAVTETEKKLSNAMAANQSRPAENGTYSGSTAGIGGVDPSKLSAAQIEEYKKRAERGEKIIF